MLRLSVNLLSNALALLRQLKNFSNGSISDSVSYYHPFSVNIDTLLDIGSICKWITYEEAYPVLTERGQSIAKDGSYGLPQECIRLMLEDYILEVKPIWRGRIPYGRKEATIIMNKDEKACFSEAGLLAEPAPTHVIDWWDHISSIIRNERNSSNLSVGRTGEKYTLQFEKIRTNEAPRWVAIESNLVGYDIISQVSSTDKARLLIEVKSSSESIDSALFYVSKNEWNVANTSANYFFYLWLLSDNQRKLAIISPDRVSSYIPINQQNGEWETVSIPYKEFSPDFIEIER